MADSSEHFNLGLALALSRRWDEACLEFEAASAADPSDLEAVFQWGKAAQAAGDHGKAEQVFRRYARSDQSRVEGKARLGVALAHLGRRAEALAVLREVRSVEPRNTLVLNALGDLEAAEGRWDEAARAWETSLAATAGQAETCFKLAFAYESLERFDDAVARYQAARKMGPRRAPVLLALAALLERLGRFAEAAPVLEEAVSTHPLDGPLALRWAAALEAKGDLDAAEAALRRAPDDGQRQEVEARRAWIRVRKGDLNGAAVLFQDALKTLVPGPSRRLAQGWLAQHAGRPEEAVEHYRAAAAEPGPAAAAAWEALAGALYRRSDLNGASQAYARLVALRPEHAEAWVRLGSLNLKLGRRGEAGLAWEHALRLDPGNSLVRRNLSVLREG